MKIISVMNDIAKDSSGDNIEPRVLSYLGFMYAKEKSGNERAVGTLGLSAGLWPTTGDLAKFTKIVNFQAAGITYFDVFGNEFSRRMYKELLLDNDPTDMKNSVVVANAYQKAMLDHNKTLMEMYDAADWFNNITEKINLLRDVEQTIAADMTDFFDRSTIGYWRKVVIILVVVVIMATVTLWIMLKGFALVMRTNAFIAYRDRLDRQLARDEKQIQAKMAGDNAEDSDGQTDVNDVKVSGKGW
jgi:hypothetical protein